MRALRSLSWFALLAFACATTPDQTRQPASGSGGISREVEALEKRFDDFSAELRKEKPDLWRRVLDAKEMSAEIRLAVLEQLLGRYHDKGTWRDVDFYVLVLTAFGEARGVYDHNTLDDRRGLAEAIAVMRVIYNRAFKVKAFNERSGNNLPTGPALEALRPRQFSCWNSNSETLRPMLLRTFSPEDPERVAFQRILLAYAWVSRVSGAQYPESALNRWYTTHGDAVSPTLNDVDTNHYLSRPAFLAALSSDPSIQIGGTDLRQPPRQDVPWYLERSPLKGVLLRFPGASEDFALMQWMAPEKQRARDAWIEFLSTYTKGHVYFPYIRWGYNLKSHLIR